jgi:cell division protein FtsQ
MWSTVALAGGWFAYDFGHFLLTSPEMALTRPDQVDLGGNHYVERGSILEIFSVDRGRSILRIPLDTRRRQIESIPWVEHATLRRALPNRIEVEIAERTPVAFLRQGNSTDLIDAHGVILDKPLEGDFHFPVVTGISADMAREDREKRMQLFSGFTQQIESAHAGAMEGVSEVDLSEDDDVRATLSGIQTYNEPGVNSSSGTTGIANQWGQSDAPVIVHFGNSDFAGKYQTLIENIGQWRATTGRVESVDLRFGTEAVVNPDRTVVAQQHSAKPSPLSRAAKDSR